MANVENILKVADAIETHAIPDLGFNMADWVGDASRDQPDLSDHNCGTVACIAGWTCAVLIGDVNKVYDLSYEEMGDLLGIEFDAARTLFLPSGVGLFLSKIRPEQAVRTLRHLAATGEVDWSIASQPLPSKGDGE